MSARRAGLKEVGMPDLRMMRWGLVLLVAVVVGCAGGPRVRRAPIDSIPPDADTETRLELLQEMALNYPDDARLYFEMGNSYYDQVLPNEARANYEKALTLDPGLNKARVNLAMLLVESDDVDSAKALLNEAIRRDPKDAKAYNNLGMLYYSELDVDSAVKYYERALEIDPDNSEARYNLGLAFAEAGLVLEAIREWRQVADTAVDEETVNRAKMSLDRAEQLLKK
jgi:tetratricopeptide (TPR) repeat protein